MLLNTEITIVLVWLCWVGFFLFLVYVELFFPFKLNLQSPRLGSGHKCIHIFGTSNSKHQQLLWAMDVRSSFLLLLPLNFQLEKMQRVCGPEVMCRL